MKTIIKIILLISLISIFSCNKKKEEEKQANVESKEAKKSYILITDIGGVNDSSFNQSSWEGLQKAANDLNIQVSYVETKQSSEMRNSFMTALEKKPSMIFSIGFIMADVAKEMADLNPDVQIVNVDYTYDKLSPNLTGVYFKAEESSFLVGYIAARMSKAKKVGFVGGVKGFIIDQFQYGFQAGVKYANNGVDVLVQYADSFADAAKGKSVTESLYISGADIVFHAAGFTGNGVIEAAKEQGKYVIGVDRDQSDLAPNNVITSAMKNVGSAIYLIVQQNEAGTFKGGSNMQFSIKDGAVGIPANTSKLVPKEIMNDIPKIEDDIKSGKIFVPYNEETFKKVTY